MHVSVEFLTKGSVAILRVAGVLDQNGAAQVYTKAEEIITSGFRNLVLNLSGVIITTPEGMMLVESIRHDIALCDGQIFVTKPQPEPAEMFNIYGLFKHLVVLPSEKEALRRIEATIAKLSAGL